ncbi:hypothetical protein BOW53_08385 [Solemya pervernicosa gill symbiont]|uniref:LysM domain-containing protein n=2 Tax=Gammaproteobacteria incertae sedis TaxID=118884 RepID=A0A1T2L588_9GAMM|nr:peptidoglycan DD-metalloendopeptidase family protein [Candidatus Reidiella endopervernicosa]OOZ40253.1 hypothetical protein BOW53_08385 [Solemya pervernicosa gill symbiont]QKQ26051.1 peptidoglycan DD-metalloendopeptidase family protein [Candidatus Reidiella endopervernicosa]
MFERDFKLEPTRRRRGGGFRASRWIALSLSVAITLFLLNYLPEKSTTATTDEAQTETLPLPLPLAAVEQPVELELSLPTKNKTAPALDKQPPISPETDWKTITVKSGDNLAAIFKRAGVSLRTMYKMLELNKEVKQLTNLYPGDMIEFDLTEENDLNQLSYEYSDTKRLLISRNDKKQFQAEHIDMPLERLHSSASATIENSLYLSAKDAGLSDNLIMELAGIFGWDIDFALDIREGDSFLVIFEELYRDGDKITNGNILAAEFINRNKSYRAIRFSDGHYYTPDGKSMRKAFLRSPVDFRRISSKFTRERYHPVLGKKRPHRGVDYAASTGTPIKAAGDGKISFRGIKGGYGRTVVIQHGTKYSTLYAHLSKFRKGKKSGSRVKQGDTIGYVGKSGLATGPHLHYEFRLNGVHRNPLTVKLPEARPIERKQMQAFLKQAEPLVSQLDSLKRTRVALNIN